MNKKKLLYMIFLMITIVLTGTLAYFTIVTDRSALVLVLGEQDEVLVTLNPFEIKGTLMSTTNYTSFETNEIENDYIQITAENVSSIPKKILFYYRINSIDDSLINTKLKYTITSSTTINGTYSEVKTGNFSTAAEGHDLTVFEFDVPENTTIFYRVFTYLDGNQNTTSMSNSLIDAEFRAEMEHIITPELDEGMIPIIFTEEGIITVSPESELGKYWYNYDKHMWANVALVTEESRSKYMGTTGEGIVQEDLLAIFVWIPRYEYRYNNLGTNYAGGTQENPGAISINFIPSYVTTPTSSAYKIHPAFTFGDTELNGFWMGKCVNEINTNNGGNASTCNNMLNGDYVGAVLNGMLNLKTQFEVSLSFNGGTLNNGQVTFEGSEFYGTTSNFDSHMAKNSEWGAASYLGQSIYGACATEIECYLGINPISTIYFDIFNGEMPGDDLSEEDLIYTQLAVYSGIVNDVITIDIENNAEMSIYTYEERTMGVLQYDSNFIYTGSSSGIWEEVITSDGTYNSGFYGYIGDVYYDTEGYTQLPPSKYYDRYTSNNMSTACNGGICYGHALSETSGWYNFPNTNFITSSSPWMSRQSLKLDDLSYLGTVFLSPSNNAGGGTGFAYDDDDNLELNNTKVSFSRTVIVKSTKNEQKNNFYSNPEEPVLDPGMIPVTISANGTVTTANPNGSGWYNYSKQEWANVVLVTDSSRINYLNNPGVEVNQSDILAYYVWIPRYSYMIPQTKCSTINNPNIDDYPGCYKYIVSNIDKNTLINLWYEYVQAAITAGELPSNTVYTLDAATTDIENGLNTGIFNVLSLGTAPSIILVELYEELTGSPLTYSTQFSGFNTTSAITEIKINFEKASAAQAQGDGINTYRTHPAFWWDNDSDGVVDSGEMVAGIWVGKFETSTDSTSACYTSNSTNNCNNANQSPRILPNVKSLRYQQIRYQFETSQKFSASGNIYGLSNTNTNSHMMKNSEWGAVAYLSHSKYGINDEIRINNNSNYITGCGASVKDGSDTSSCQIPYNSLYTPQSTTGNITGIYDMSGGSWEYVMGVLADSNGNPRSGNDSESNSGFNGLLSDGTSYTSGVNFPASKYFDLYTGTGPNDSCNGGICYGHALSETSGWHGNFSNFVYADSPWFIRGGLYGAGAGAFDSSIDYGDALGFTSWRSVLVVGFGA